MNNCFKILLITLLFFGFSLQQNAQTTLDSLVHTLNSNTKVEEKLEAILDASNTLIYSNPDTLVYYSNYALKMCDKYSLERQKLNFLVLLGEIHFALSNYSEAIDYTFSAIKICEQKNDSFELANLYNSVGSIYRVSYKMDEAKAYFLKSIDLRNKLKDSVGLASVYNNIGIIYMMTAKYDTGMDYWSKSLETKLAIGDSVGAATTMNNMAMYYRDIGETQKALNFFNEVLRIKKNIKDHGSVSLVYNNLGELYIKQNNIPKGLDYYFLALEEANISKNKQMISHVHAVLAQTYYNIGDYKKAYDYFIIHSAMEDSIFNEETVNTLEEVESKYQNEKKALIIKNLEKEKLAQKEKQNLIVISSALGFLAMLTIVIIIFKNYQQKKKDNLIISEQKAIVEEKNKEITDSITYARRLQEAILPPTELITEFFPKSFVVFKPKDVVSGDFYWLEPIAKDEVIFAVADCTGHGVPGAMVSVVCSNALNRAVKEFELQKPNEILDKVRELVIETFDKSNESVKDGMDIALCNFNLKTKELQYAGANNPLWILKKDSNEIEEIKADKQPIGKYHDFKPYTNHKIILAENDSFYLFSDGYADQFGGNKGKKLKYRPFKNILIEISNMSENEQHNVLLNKFDEWKGSIEQIDDICIMGIRV